METCKNINDIHILFNDYDVVLKHEQDKVYLLMEPTDDWAPVDEPSIPKRDLTDDTNFKREVHDVCRGLGNNPQFLRCTSVAHHFTNWAMSDEGRGCGICKLEKKAGIPFTVYFYTVEQALHFVSMFTLYNALRGHNGPADKN